MCPPRTAVRPDPKHGGYRQLLLPRAPDYRGVRPAALRTPPSTITAMAAAEQRRSLRSGRPSGSPVTRRRSSSLLLISDEEQPTTSFLCRVPPCPARSLRSLGVSNLWLNNPSTRHVRQVQMPTGLCLQSLNPA